MSKVVAKRVLVMDDESQMRQFYSEVLKVLGYDSETTPDGETAIQRFREGERNGQPFDIVIMDLRVPEGMGGQATLALLQRDYPKVRAVVVSASIDDAAFSDFRQAGFVGALAKPFHIAELRSLLEEALENN